MIDVRSYIKTNSRHYSVNDDDIKELTDELLYLAAPTLEGFNLASKQVRDVI